MSVRVKPSGDYWLAAVTLLVGGLLLVFGWDWDEDPMSTARRYAFVIVRGLLALAAGCAGLLMIGHGLVEALTKKVKP